MSCHRVLSFISLAVGLMAFVSPPTAVARTGGLEPMPSVLELESGPLQLNGKATRKKLFIPIYELGVYLPVRQTDATEVITSRGPKALRLDLRIGLSGETIGSAIARGFERNSGDQLAGLMPRLDRLRTLFPAVKRGDSIVLRWAPGEGTVIELQERRLGVIEGKDFSDALMSVWLGEQVADPAMKHRLLGGEKGRRR